MEDNNRDDKNKKNDENKKNIQNLIIIMITAFFGGYADSWAAFKDAGRPSGGSTL